MSSFTLFNLVEGVFWLFCSLISLIVIKYFNQLPKKFWKILSLNFFIFGISDFVEAYYPTSFVEFGGYWLLVWKTVCVIGFVVIFFWYIKIRLNETQDR